MQTFTIEPNIGPVPLRFGMSPEEVATILGKPVELLPSSIGSPGGQRQNISLGYTADMRHLVEAVFSTGVCVLFAGKDLFEVEDPVSFLRKYDKPYKAVGMIFFLELGIRISGYSEGEEDEKAIGVVRKGHYDEYLEQFKPYYS